VTTPTPPPHGEDSGREEEGRRSRPAGRRPGSCPPARLDYTDAGKLFNGEPRLYPRGKFIYRLAGREREKSALVLHARGADQVPGGARAQGTAAHCKTADDILKLTVCEPAMGSAAFLNEAINQLAEAYLQRKQKELGRTIPTTSTTPTRSSG
jgi:hypothetical protein